MPRRAAVRHPVVWRLTRIAPVIGGALWLAGQSAGAQPNRFHQVNLVSDIPGLAAHTDPQLINPWGISFGPTTPFWVSDNGTGVSTLYNGLGVKQGLVVTIPGAPGTTQGAPTGQVFNNTGAFMVNGNPARFIFAEESGTISAWNGGTNAVRTVITPNGSYKGLAIAGTDPTTARLFAANFANGTVDAFDGTFSPITTSGGFTDPTLPSGFSPFNVQNIGGSLYVTYALRDPITGDDVPGPGNGFIDVFDTDGHMLRRLVSNGVLNSPWGLAQAPFGFGPFGNDLLVGNFGDGTINAFDPTTGALRGTLLDGMGDPLTIDGLWGIAFGNGGPGFHSQFLYFAAGLNDEQDGLFGALAPVPEPSTVALVATGLGALLLGVRRRRA